jgi:hypothetical protein
MAAAELSSELSVIARNERRFIGFGNDDLDLTRKDTKARLVTNMHKPNLEWDLFI